MREPEVALIVLDTVVVRYLFRPAAGPSGLEDADVLAGGDDFGAVYARVDPHHKVRDDILLGCERGVRLEEVAPRGAGHPEVLLVVGRDRLVMLDRPPLLQCCVDSRLALAGVVEEDMERVAVPVVGVDAVGDVPRPLAAAAFVHHGEGLSDAGTIHHLAPLIYYTKYAAHGDLD